MRIGAIGSTMTTPYIYNTNRVSSASLNKVEAIGDDLTKAKTDFSDLASQENVNPLMPGQSSDYKGLVDMQMQMGQMNAARLFA